MVKGRRQRREIPKRKSIVYFNEVYFEGNWVLVVGGVRSHCLKKLSQFLMACD